MWPFKKDSIKEESVKEPVKGELWYLRNDSPWPDKDDKGVSILDCKEGWVRYKVGPIFDDERMMTDLFISCYVPNTKQESL